VIKVVRVALIAVLQLMEEIQEVECECRRGSVDRCGEPASTKDLRVLGNRLPHVAATAEANNETVNTIEVEYHQVMETRRKSARVASAVAELVDEAESSEAGVLEELSIPFLGYTQHQRYAR
jgi:hypothetical protein